MRGIGTIFLYAGTIAGLTAAARIPPDFTIFWISLAALLIGILLRTVFSKRGGRITYAAGIEDLRNPLMGAFREVQSLIASREVLDLRQLHERIDRIVNDNLYNFGISCSSMKSMFGINGYNAVMMHFAIAERYVNRVWSASADGYLEESLDYLERAEPEFREALSMIDSLHDRQNM